MATKNRLIDAREYRSVLEEEIICHKNEDVRMGLEIAIADLSDEPTVDAVEVVHGEWVEVIRAVVDTTGYCTRCDKQAVWRTSNKPYAVCPNCGAYMRGIKDDS